MTNNPVSEFAQPHNLPEHSEITADLRCPVGEQQCAVIDEVKALRAELSQLTQLLHTDPLTGLFNYRHLLQVLEQEMERTHRSGLPTALIMIDLDYFKQVNDQWGHEVGNEALKMTAGVLRRVVRRLDIACRYGGEEFTVILPSTDMLTATQVAERIRAAIAQQPVMTGNGDISLTASLGVETFYAHQQETPEQFIARADENLYRAKQQGRNRVIHGAGELSAETTVSREERDLLASLFGDNDNNHKK